MPLLAHRLRSSVVIAYVAFVLTGIGASVGTVVLPAQIADYGVDRQTIGLTFFTFSAGFFLAGATTGSLIARLGTRTTLLLGSVAYVASALYLASRPSFVALVVVQLLAGYGGGLVESVLNAYLAELPSATRRLNLLHAFFGVGALIGPVLATWLLRSSEWTVVWLVLGLAGIPLGAAYALAYPNRTVGRVRADVVDAVPAGAPSALGAEAVVTGATTPEHGSTHGGAPERAPHEGLLADVLREPGVVLAALFLTVYVGLEVSVGNWGVSYLVEARDLAEGPAGASVSGYWLGLTVGRFVIEPAARALRWTTVRTIAVCLVGVIAAAALVAALPSGLAAAGGLALLGFFLGPLFPTAIAVVPRLTTPRLAATAVGLMNAVSVVGGSALPWLAGALGDGVGIWTLLPFATVLGVVQLLVWRLVVARMRS